MAKDIKRDMPVFLRDGEGAIGSVRHAPHPGHPDLVVYVENSGDFLVHADAVLDVHFDKVVLDIAKVDRKLLAAAGHIRDAEDDADHTPVDKT